MWTTRRTRTHERVRIDQKTWNLNSKLSDVIYGQMKMVFPSNQKNWNNRHMRSGIIEAIAEMYLAGILTQDGVING
ncbi:MAG: hypothetical protein Ct9H300mP28_22570 [Pseudomonadota bacterium]|nr:MAG: hypothetical protein Ct9H300mP28_22570 [Pseudomonadota bacterium]